MKKNVVSILVINLFFFNLTEMFHYLNSIKLVEMIYTELAEVCHFDRSPDVFYQDGAEKSKNILDELNIDYYLSQFKISRLRSK